MIVKLKDSVKVSSKKLYYIVSTCNSGNMQNSLYKEYPFKYVFLKNLHAFYKKGSVKQHDIIP